MIKPLFPSFECFDNLRCNGSCEDNWLAHLLRDQYANDLPVAIQDWRSTESMYYGILYEDLILLYPSIFIEPNYLAGNHFLPKLAEANNPNQVTHVVRQG